MDEEIDLGNTAVTTYRLEGRIVDMTTGHGVDDVYIELWDHEGLCRDLVAVTKTDALGDFSFALASTYLDTIFIDRRPPLAFRLFKGGQFDPPSATWELSHDPSSIRIVVNPSLTNPNIQPSNFVVRGRLTDASGTPMQNRTVRAFDRGLNGEVVLRRSISAPDVETDAEGRYHITFPTSALGRSGKLQADLVVRAFDDADVVIAESSKICRAPATAIVDLVPLETTLRGPSEYDQLLRLVISVISDGTIASLSEDQISYIACTTGEARDRIALFVVAAQLAGEIGTEHVLVYALLRQNLPATRRGLLAQRQATLRDAIARSMGQNIISTASQAEIDALIASLLEKMTDLAFEPRVAGGGCLGAVLETADLGSTTAMREFVRAAIEHEGTIDQFWTNLASSTTFSGAGTIDRLKRTMQFGALARYHRPLVAKLHELYAAGLTNLRDLARYDADDWLAMITAAGETMIDCPPDTPGADPAARRANYASILARTVETAFPTAVIADRIKRDEGAAADISVFFTNNPNFELGATRVSTYLENTSGAMRDVSDVAATTQRLKGIERIFRITRRHSEMKPLLSAGLHSAQSIHRMGKRRFLGKFGGTLGTQKAEQIFGRACWTASAATALLGKYGSGVNGPLVYALPDLVTPAQTPHQDIADFATLFGTLDGCACEHCRSVYGPAAYLVDLLEFLDRQDSEHETPDSTPQNRKYYTARDVLLGDLDNPSGGPEARRPDIARILLSCENTNTALPYIDLVNEILEVSVANAAADPDQVWPATIGSTWTSAELLAEPEVVHPAARQVAYAELSNTAFPFVLPFHLWTEEARIYLDHLGVPRHELLEALVAAKKTPPADVDDAIARERLRMSKREWDILVQEPLNAPTTAACWGVQSIASLSSVPRFLKQAGISFEELRELLATEYVNPSAPATVNLVPAEGCDIDSRTLSGLDDAILGRIHRFLRLRKWLGVGITELDLVMSAFGATDTGAAMLRNVADLRALRESLALPLPVLLSLWGPLGTRTTEWATSIYDALFVDKSVPAPNPFVTESGTVVQNAAGVLAGLRINALEFGILAMPDVAQQLTGVTSVLPVNAALSVPNLSRLHRVVTLARALGLGIRDFWVLHSLAGMNALEGDASLSAKPAATRAFVALVEKVRRSKLTIAEISYLVRHVALPGTSVGRSDDELTSLVASIEAGIAEIVAARKAAPDPEPPQTPAELLANDVAGFVKQKLATEFGLDADVVAYLLEHALSASSAANAHAIVDFLPAPAPEPTSAHRTSTLRRFEKAALVVERLDFDAAELGRLYPAGASTTWLDLNTLPIDVDNDASAYQARFATLMRLVELVAVRDAFPGKREALLAILGAATTGALYEEIAHRTGWAKTDIENWAVSMFEPAAPEIADFRDENFLGRLQRAFALLGRLGASAAQAFSWTNIDAPLPPAAANAADIALDIKRVARAKYDDARWTEVARPLRNVLREKQRDALVGYLVAKHDLDGTNDLFAHLLIDVEMSPCQLTSRIKQAIGSVQTFVQRALLRLEADHVVLGEDAAREWEWMKSYRVWEANRKVFLYPENWIEPELRDDKTPFFEAFENRLLQGEINAETAESAYLEYLEKLHDVARLDVAAMCYERTEGDDSVDIVHVIARTPVAPHRYYYRRREDGDHWTPWEPIDLDIAGDHLLATVWNRRLHLLWPVFEERADDNGKDKAPSKYWQIGLAWSELRDGAWGPIKTTADKTLRVAGAIGRHLISFMVEPQQAALKVTCLVNWFGVRIKEPYPAPMMAWYGVAGDFVLGPCSGEIFIHREKRTFAQKEPWTNGTNLAGWAPQYAMPTYMKFQEVANSLKNPVHQLVKLPMFKSSSSAQDKWSSSVGILHHTPGDRFWLLQDRHAENVVYDILAPRSQEVLFFKDDRRVFFMDLQRRTKMAWKDLAEAYPGSPAPIVADGDQEVVLEWANEPKLDLDSDYYIERFYRFQGFYHPYVCDFTRLVAMGGVDRLLRWPTSGSDTPIQNASRDIHTEYVPLQSVAQPFPVENVDFSYGGTYSQYNWELFFHAPLLVATRLSKNSRFEEADRWFRYIFDPTGGAPGNGPERFWNVRPFRENIDLASIQAQLEQLSAENPNAQVLADLFGATFESGASQDIAAQIARWRDNPFNPHLIARMRPLAHQKAVVMKYVENLIAWGDSLFRRETIEAINEATQLYILASQILGDRPRLLKERNVPLKTYAELEPLVDAFSNALVAIESILPAPPSGDLRCGRREPHPALRTLYFCIPQNEKMLALWDTVGDRLFKVRHCMNIDGTVRQLPLFEPPIDPALLVKAAAAGVDFGSVLSDLHVALPIYRFSVLQPKAMEFAGSVVAMGGALLSALEKRDGEALSRMRARHESEMLAAVRAVRKRQVDEAKESLEAIRRSRTAVEVRWNHYDKIEDRIPEERAQQDLTVQAGIATYLAQSSQLFAAELKILPQIIVGLGAGTEFGGEQLAGVAELGGQFFGMVAAQLSTSASMAATEAGYRRRAAEWKLQKDLAEKELAQFDRQIAAAEIRLELAKKELANHDRSIENAKEVEDYLKTKYTNTELYDWVVSQVASVYFQAYKLAFEMARRAEKAFQFELAQPDANYVTFGWDSLKKGLLAGEKLQHDLRRMEAAYLEQNKREYEITKHISLAEIAPHALFDLKESRTCEVTLPEWLFDRDWPGHYLRRIKSVSMTVPVVNGPYTGVNCKLTLLNSSVRMKTDLDQATGYRRKADEGGPGTRFRDYYGAVQSIVTSSGQSDAGLFELVFRDERYLPFEGSGAESKWRIELDERTNRFDPMSIHDVVLHVRYMARDGGDALKSGAETYLDVLLPGGSPENADAMKGYRLFSAKTEFPEAWAAFIADDDSDAQTLALPLVSRLFQSLRGSRQLEIKTLHLYAKWSEGYGQGVALKVHVAKPSAAFDVNPIQLDPWVQLPQVAHFIKAAATQTGVSILPADAPWRVQVKSDHGALGAQIGNGNWKLKADALEDIWVVCEYERQ